VIEGVEWPSVQRAAMSGAREWMTRILSALAGISLLCASAADARSAKPKRPPTGARKAVPAPRTVPDITPSAAALRVADWIATSGDNQTLPYAIVDKTNAALFLYDADGNPLAQVPVLIGIAPGDDATPGVGTKDLSELGPAEKTTPAGRFLAKFGLAAGGVKVLWVDYADSVAMHPIPSDAAKSEKRRDRMLSATAEDNRITFGCINVPLAFYGKILRPLFLGQGGYVYVLPDTKPLEDVFPRLRVHALTYDRAAS